MYFWDVYALSHELEGLTEVSIILFAIVQINVQILVCHYFHSCMCCNHSKNWNLNRCEKIIVIFHVLLFLQKHKVFYSYKLCFSFFFDFSKFMNSTHHEPNMHVITLFLKPCKSFWGLRVFWNRLYKLFSLVLHTWF